ncbi:MAG: hypothetical protein NW216_04280 [Hyphomicrobium sp.]|nr:hypothetical protein [Hyphomicrobium sp.]
MTPPTSRRLPFWRTVIDAHVETIGLFPLLARVAWPWLAVLMLVMSALYWLLWPLEQAIVANGGTGSYAMLILPTFVPLMIGAFVAVPWHRALLKGEAISSMTGLRLMPIALRYFGWTSFFAMFLMGPLIAGYVYADISASFAGAISADIDSPSTGGPSTDGTAASLVGGSAPWLDGPAMIVGIMLTIFGPLALCMFIPTRLTLMLPAIAVGAAEPDPSAIWKATRGNFWRLYLGGLLALLIPVTLMLFQTAVEAPPATRGAFIASSIMTDMILFLAGMVEVTFLSIAYQRLVLDPGLPETKPAQWPLATTDKFP